MVILGLALTVCRADIGLAWAEDVVPSATKGQNENIAAKNAVSGQVDNTDFVLEKEQGTLLPKSDDLHKNAGAVKTDNSSNSTNKNNISDSNEASSITIDGADVASTVIENSNNLQDLDALTAEDESEGAYNYKIRQDDNLLIVGVVVGKTILDDGFLIYLDDDDIIIPLGSFAELLGFPIDVNPETGTATGWFINEKNSFELKRPYKFAHIKGKKIQVTNNDIVENHEDDIYVNKELIEKWFPIEISFNFQDLTIYLSTKEDLPFQARAKRLERWQNVKKQISRSGQTKIGKDVIRLPYKKLSFPTIQVNQNLNIRENADNSRQLISTHSATIDGDFLGMNMRSSIILQQTTTGDSQIQNSEFLLSKEDFEGKIAGPLKATQLAIGDVSSYQFPLGGGSKKGRGITISNAPVSFVRSAKEHIVKGYAPVGWDVEVYQDNRLLDFTRIGDDGYYRFEALPLRSGFNLFHIIMYGPNGEQREEFERLYLGNNMVEPGEFIYEVNAIQSSSPLFDLRKNKAKSTDPTFSFLGEYGLAKNLSVTGGYYTAPATDTENLNGVMMGLRASGKSGFAQFDIFRNRDGARSVSLDVRGNLGSNLSWSAGHIRHRGYAKNIKRVEQESYLHFAHNVSAGNLPKFSYSFDFKRRLWDTGTRETIVSNQFSSTIFGLNFNNNIDYTFRDNSDYKQIIGKLTLYRKSPFGVFRGNINYHLDSPATINSTNLQWQKTLSQKLALNALLDKSFGDNPKTTISGGVDVKQDKYRLGITGSLSDKGDKRIGMNLAYNFIPQSLNGDYKITSESVNNGHIILKPFIDSNQDGMYTESEELLAGIKFKNMLRGTEATTNEAGTAVLAGLAPNAVNKITIDEETMPDIYLTPLKEETKILGRRGVNGPIYVPIQQLGEISGIVTIIDNKTGEDKELADLPIQLLNSKGEVVAETTTEYDGFYSFPSLPMGLYEMFFPTSKALDIQYSGEGTGPRFELSSDEPEVSDGDVVMKHRQLGQAGHISGETGGGSADGPKNNKNNGKLDFIGIVNKPINQALERGK